MSKFKSSDELAARMIALGTGEIEPEDDEDRQMLADYKEIIDDGGEVWIPFDLPDPLDSPPAKQKSLIGSFAISFKWGLRTPSNSSVDGDGDGVCDEGTGHPHPCAPHEVRRAMRAVRRTENIRRAVTNREPRLRSSRSRSDLPEVSDSTYTELKKNLHIREIIQRRFGLDRERRSQGLSPLNRDKFGYLEPTEIDLPVLIKNDPKSLLAQGKSTMDFIKTPNGIIKPDRARQHEKILDAIMFPQGVKPISHPPGERRAWLLGGGPGSGKTYLKKIGFIDFPDRGIDSVHIEADEMKEMTGEYRKWKFDGIPEASGLVHEESSYLAAEALRRSAENGFDVVLDGTGDGSPEGFKNKAKMLKDQGYTISGRYVVADIVEAAARARKRQAETGRSVPYPALHDIHVEIARAIPDFVKSGVFDDLEVWDNNDMNEPVLIASARGKNLKVVDPVKWNDFIANASRNFMEIPETVDQEDQRGRLPGFVSPSKATENRIHTQDTIKMILAAMSDKKFNSFTSPVQMAAYKRIKDAVDSLREQGVEIELPHELPDDFDYSVFVSAKSLEQGSSVIDLGEPRIVRKKRKRKLVQSKIRSVDGWQNLRERPVLGIATLPGGGLVSASTSGAVAGTGVAGKSARKARSDRLAATSAPIKDRVVGSQRNPIGSAASSSSGKNIEIDQATLTSLKAKVKDHNDSVKGQESWKKANLGTLKSVYRRGAGAFSVSHRPGMTRNQWAMGRVNAFLKILKNGHPENKRYVGDNDLLHSRHPWKK